jgi:GMP synthase (glutamine-hydrolysing)
MKILSNFIDISGCNRQWSSKAFLDEIINHIQSFCKNKKVSSGLRGVDSTVAFTLLNKALGKERVLGLHIDTGLMDRMSPVQ